jgi:DNA helicase-2/ATP-dependent DNA helicase PcrA
MISYSKLNTYNTCPKQYKFKYVEKDFGDGGIPAVQFGSLVHEILSKFTAETTKEDIGTIIDGMVKEYAKKYPYEMFQDAEDVIYDWFEEDKFTKTFAVEQELKYKIGKCEIIGYIDRLDKIGEGEYEVVDYKVGNFLYTEQSLATSLQLEMYALGIHKLYDAFSVTVTYDNVLQNKQFSREVIDFDIIEQRIENYIDAMLSDTEFEPRISNMCAYCFFKSKCSEYQEYITNELNVVDDPQVISKEYFRLKQKQKELNDTISQLSEILSAMGDNLYIHDTFDINVQGGKVYVRNKRR